MDNQREGDEAKVKFHGKTPTKPSTESTNLRSLAVLILSICEFMFDVDGDSREREILASARELVRRTQ